MSPSLLALSLSLVAAAPPDPAVVSLASTLAAASAASGSSAHAKAGLLPRRTTRSRVVYLAGAAIPDAEPASSPALEAVPASDVVTTPDGDAAPSVPMVRGAEVAVDASTPAPDDASAAAPIAPVAPKQLEQPADAPAPVPDATAASAAPAAPTPEAAPPAPAVAIERVVDAAGEVVVRLTGSDAKVIAERVVCSLGDLPVLSTRRADDGGVVQVVADEWGGLEVRRDAVGRFVSARPIERAAHPGRQD